MKTPITLRLFYFLFFSSSALITQSCIELKNIHTEEESKSNLEKATDSEENDADNPSVASFEEHLKTLDPASGITPTENLEMVRDQMNNNSRLASSCVTWQERGPGNVGGRTRALAFDPNDPTHKKVWAGSVSGGLWFTNDITLANPVWTPVDDFWANISIGSIAFNPTQPNEIYVGTGEAYLDADFGRGAGIWKSVDDGLNWTRFVIPSTVDPAFFYTEKLVFNSTGDLFAGTRNGGVQKYDGTNWVQVLGTASGNIPDLMGGASYAVSNNEVADLEIASDGTLFVSLGLNPHPGEVYRSTNNGFSWVRLSNSNSGCGFANAGSFSRVELASAPSDPNTLYAFPASLTTANSNGSSIGCYRSTNKGLTWTLTSGGLSNNQCGYDVTAIVDPSNSQIVYSNSTTDIYYTTNGGNSWSIRSVNVLPNTNRYIHADQQCFEFEPGSNGSKMLIGTDGGIFYSSNINTTGSPTFVDKNGSGIDGYITSQFNSCAMEPTAGSNYILGGTQDNECPLINPGNAGVADNSADSPISDGGNCFIDKWNGSSIYINSRQNCVYNLSTSGLPGTFSSMIYQILLGRHVNPSDYDYINHILFAAEQVNNIIRIDNLLNGPIVTSIPVPSMTQTASFIKVSPTTTLNNTVLYLATSSDQYSPIAVPKLWKVTGANTLAPTFTSITPPLSTPGAYISCIELGAPGQILLTYSNYNIVSVWESLNDGATWTSREGNLPDMPVRFALYNPLDRKEVFLATEVGIWSTQNINGNLPGQQADWGMTQSELAHVRVDMLRYRASDNKVLVATYGRGIFSTDFFNHPIAAFSILPVGNCSNFTTSFIDQSTNNATTWHWNFDDPGSGPNNTSTLQNPLHYFTTTGQHNVSLTVSNASGCNTVIQTIIIQSVPNCCQTFGTQLLQTSFNTTVPPVTGSFDLFEASSNIVIPLGTTVTLNNAHISIPEGYSITVKGGGNLEILNNSELFACSNMWKGIIVEPGGHLVMNNSTIRDAQNGLFVQPEINGSQSQVIINPNSKFVDNYIGINCPAPVIPGSNLNSVFVQGASFLGTGTLHPGYSSQNPAPLSRPLAGIFIDDFQNLTLSVLNPSFFENLNFGIYSLNSNLNMNKSKFRLIKRYDNYTQFSANLGSAIYCTQNSTPKQLNLNGTYDPINMSTPDFEECRRAIVSNGCNIKSKFNWISNCDFGTIVSIGRYLNIDISDNFIDCNATGILLNANQSTTSGLILRNKINCGAHPFRVDGTGAPSRASGIVVRELNTNNPSMILSQNTIHLYDYGNVGIDLTAAEEYIMNFNYITLSNPAPTTMKGFRLRGSHNNIISCNSVSGTNLNQMDYDVPDEVAMSFQDSYTNEIKCNAVTNTSNGIMFAANCYGGAGLETQLRNNDIGNHYYGLNYTPSAIVDQQYSRGNLWYLDNYLGFAAINSNPNANAVGLEIYKVDQNGPNFPSNTNNPDPSQINVIANVTWFFPTLIRDEECGSTHHGDCATGTVGGENTAGLFSGDNLIALNMISSQDFDEQTKWKARVALYEKLLKLPEYRDSSVDLANFYLSMAGSTIQEIASLNVSRNDLFPNQSNLVSTVENNSALIYNQSTELATILDQLQASGISQSAQNTMEARRDFLINSIQTLNNTNKTSWEILKTSIENHADLLSQSNDQINSNKIFEQNEKAINDIHLNEFAKYDDEQLQLSGPDILTIASQCPLEGGPAVYRAQTLYSALDPEYSFDDVQACLQNGWLLRQSNRPKQRSIFEIYPNPTSDFIHIRYTILEPQNFQLIDNLGRVVFEKILDEKEKEVIINTYELHNGLYSFRTISKNEEQNNTGHLSIVR